MLFLAGSLMLSGNVGAEDVGAASRPARMLETLERERARLLIVQFDPALAAADRIVQTRIIARRLVDLERMVLRNESRAAQPNAALRQAFANYDLTFLVHAAAEKGVSVMEVWLTEIGVSSEAARAARIGRR